MSTTAQISLAQYEIMMESGVFAGGMARQRVELIQGDICEMSPIGNDHNLVVGKFTDWCYDHWLREQYMIRVQAPILIPPNNSAPEPDIAIVTRKRYTRHPLAEDVQLLVEISDSSLAADIGEKLSMYADAGIEDYWVVNIPSRVIHVYRSPRDGAFQDVATYRCEEPINPLKNPSAIATAGVIFAVLD